MSVESGHSGLLARPRREPSDANSEGPFAASIVIPAHNEEGRIGDLLRALLRDAEAARYDVIVVCNGCADNTAQEAGAQPGVRVVELQAADKDAALRTGDALARVFPRIYLDADVELGARDVGALIAVLTDERGALAAYPERRLDATGASYPVRAYYEVWRQLPVVREGLFGRGIIAISAKGHERLAGRPVVINDDLYADLAFSPAERRSVPEAVVSVRTPRRARDLIRRRVRTEAGNRQQNSASSRGSRRTLGRLLLTGPRWWPRVAVFVSITILARARFVLTSWLGGDIGWGRDESSRSAGH